MHFVGMLAFRSPVPVTYAVAPTVLSLLVAVAATAAAFFWASRTRAGWGVALIGGLCLGMAIAGMHYIGMSAMRMPMAMSFGPGRVLLSVLIAVVASTAGLSIAFRRQSVGCACRSGRDGAGGGGHALYRHVGGGFSGAPRHRGAPCDMPMQTGMPHRAACWARAAWCCGCSGATAAILLLALVASAISQGRSQRLLRTSEARFRTAAEAVGDIIWTNSPEGRMLGEQADWARFTGQRRAAVPGLRLDRRRASGRRGAHPRRLGRGGGGAADLHLRAPRAPA